MIISSFDKILLHIEYKCIILFKKISFIFSLHIWVLACMYVCALHSAWCPQKSKHDVGLPGTEVTKGCELPYGCWEVNLGSLQEQHVLLTTRLISLASYSTLIGFLNYKFESLTHLNQWILIIFSIIIKNSFPWWTTISLRVIQRHGMNLIFTIQSSI